jgi:ATP-dependent DNA helicase RecQ
LYEFQVRNPKFDHLIKTILRSHGGVFEGYVEINEQTLASRAGVSKDEFIKDIELLDQLKILSYIPSSDFPQIVFLEERLDERDIRIDRQHLADRKERQLKRVKAIIAYATETSKCRSLMLLDYFGEEKEQRCGVCDYCLNRNKLGLSDLDFENVQTQVKSILMDHPLELNELAERINPDKIGTKRDHNIKVIEWLIDNEKIRYEEGNLLKWNE